MSPEEPDLECADVSLEFAVVCDGSCSGGRRPRRPDCLPSCGVTLLPMGVLSRSGGGASCGISWIGGIDGSSTGLWFGDAGIDRPRGMRPRLRLREPGIGGRRRGAGESEDMVV
jgi:hypothetical protein